jgi:hypothetical protein
VRGSRTLSRQPNSRILTPPAPASSFARGALAALALLAITSAQSLQCGNELCFAGPINDGVVLQRAPAHAAVLGSVPPASPAGAAMSLTLAGVDGSGAAYNKSFAFAAMADSTWKLVLPDAFEAGGNFSILVTCPACAGGVTGISRTNVTFGDVWVCSGQSNMQLGMWSSFLQDEIDARVPGMVDEALAKLPSLGITITEVLSLIESAPSCVRAKPGSSTSRPPAQLTPWPGQAVQASTSAPPSL